MPCTVPGGPNRCHELFFRQYGVHNCLMVASFQERGDSFVLETPRVWFEKRIPSFRATSEQQGQRSERDEQRHFEAARGDGVVQAVGQGLRVQERTPRLLR